MFVTDTLPFWINNLLNSVFDIFGYVSVVGSYLLQPISKLGDLFIGSYTNFYGSHVNISIQPIPLLDNIGEIVSQFAGDTPIVVFLSALLLTIGLIASCIRRVTGL